MVSELVLLRPASVPTNDDFYVRVGQCRKRESMISDLKNFINLRFKFPRPQVFVGEDGGVVITGLYDGIPADADYSHEAFDHIIDLVGWIEGCVKLPISSDSVAHKVFEEMSPVAITSEIDQLLKLDGKRIIENMGLDQNPIYEVLKRDVIAIHGEEMAQAKLKSESNNAKHLADSVAQQVLDEMTEQRTNFNTIEVCHLTDSKHLMLSNQGLTGFTGMLDELIIQDDVSFDPGGELNADLGEKSDVIDNDDVFTAERLIIDDDVVNQDEELVQIKANDDSKVENGTTHSAAQQLLDEMPEWKFSAAIKFGMLSQSRASSFGSLMNPPHYLAPYFGSTEVNFTLQKWLLRIAWAALNTDAEMLPFEPGGTWLIYLTDKIDHKAMLVGFIEERDDMKTFKASEHRKTIRPLTSDKEPHNLTVFEMCFVPGGRLYASSEAFMVMVNTEFADVGDSLGDKYKLKLFEGEFALDQGGGLHTSSNTVLSTDATKLTEIGNWSVQLSCAEIWVTTTDNHVGSWKSKVTSENGEFMLRNVDEDNLRSLYSIRMQKLELFDHDQLMGLSEQDDCVKLLMFELEHGEFMLVELVNGFMLQDGNYGESLPSYKAFKPLVFDPGIIFEDAWKNGAEIASVFWGTDACKDGAKFADVGVDSRRKFLLKSSKENQQQSNLICVKVDIDYWASVDTSTGVLIFDPRVHLSRVFTEPFLEELHLNTGACTKMTSFDPGGGRFMHIEVVISLVVILVHSILLQFSMKLDIGVAAYMRYTLGEYNSGSSYIYGTELHFVGSGHGKSWNVQFMHQGGRASGFYLILSRTCTNNLPIQPHKWFESLDIAQSKDTIGIWWLTSFKYFPSRRKLHDKYSFEFDYVKGYTKRSVQVSDPVIGVSCFITYVDGVDFLLINCALLTGIENNIYGSQFAAVDEKMFEKTQKKKRNQQPISLIYVEMGNERCFSIAFSHVKLPGHHLDIFAVSSINA